MAITTVLIVLVILITIFLLIGVPAILGVINAVTQKPDCSNNQECPEGTTCRQSPYLYCDAVECSSESDCKGENTFCYNQLCYPFICNEAKNCTAAQRFLEILLINQIGFKLKAGTNYVNMGTGQNKINPLQISPTTNIDFVLANDNQTDKNNKYLVIRTIGTTQELMNILVSGKDKKSSYQMNQDYLEKCPATACNSVINCTSDACVYGIPFNFQIQKTMDKTPVKILQSSLENVCTDFNCKPILEIDDQGKIFIKVGSFYLEYNGTNFALSQKRGSGYKIELSTEEVKKIYCDDKNNCYDPSYKMYKGQFNKYFTQN